MTNIIKFSGNISIRITRQPPRTEFVTRFNRKKKNTYTHTHVLIKLHREQPSLTHQIPLASWPKSWLASFHHHRPPSARRFHLHRGILVLTLNAEDTGRIVDLSSVAPSSSPRLMTFVTTASWKVKQIVYARQRNEEYVSPAALKPAVEMNTTPRS